MATTDRIDAIKAEYRGAIACGSFQRRDAAIEGGDRPSHP